MDKFFEELTRRINALIGMSTPLLHSSMRPQAKEVHDALIDLGFFVDRTYEKYDDGGE